MEHITDDVVGKRVLDHEGREIGKITAVDGDSAILKGQTGVSAQMEEAFSTGEGDRLALSPEQIESVDDESVRVADLG
ncbi:hypothetical protein ACNS7O_09390 [Haloferacaceae archaeon DSL9]